MVYPAFPLGCNGNMNLQRHLGILTGWALFATFSATGFRRQKRFVHHSSSGPTDMLFFSKG